MQLTQRIQSFAAILVSLVSLAAVSHYLWQESQSGGFGFILMLIVGPVIIGGLLLAWRYRSDIARDPMAPIALALTGCVVVCLASLPEALGLYEFGWDSPKKFAISVGMLLLCQSYIRPAASAFYRCLHRSLKGLVSLAN